MNYVNFITFPDIIILFGFVVIFYISVKLFETKIGLLTFPIGLNLTGFECCLFCSGLGFYCKKSNFLHYIEKNCKSLINVKNIIYYLTISQFY